MRRNLFLLFCVALAACEEGPLIENEMSATMQAPVSMALIPGTPFGVVASSNAFLEEKTGSLVALNLDTREVLYETQIAIPNFAGEIAVEATEERIYIADRGDDALLVYQYSIPGDGGIPISFEPVDVEIPATKEIPNGIETDEDPYGLYLDDAHNRLFVGNSESGSVSIISTKKLKPSDRDPEDGKLFGLPLISAANFNVKDDHPGRGVNRLRLGPDNKLLFLTSTLSAQIYVLDSIDQVVEAMIDLSPITPSGDTRGIAIDSTGIGYVACRGSRGVLVLDLSGVTDNGIDGEVIDVPLLDLIPTGHDPDGVVLTVDEGTLFVSEQERNAIVRIDTATRAIVGETVLAGNVPGELVADVGRNVFYSLNFLSNNISILNLTTGALEDTLK